jgi:Phage portal protein
MRPWFAPPGRGRKSWSQPPIWSLDALRLPFLNPSLPDRERIENDFEGYVQGAYKTNGIIFACIRARQSLFSQARFQWHEFSNGRPGTMFGSTELTLLEKPWPGGTTVDLLSRMEIDVSLAGNFFATIGDDAGNLGKSATGPGRRVVHLRPDWMSIIFDSKTGNTNDADTRIVAYLYEPRPQGGLHAGTPVTLLPSEVCHYAPYPDPAARFRGMSWLTPILTEIGADKAATVHKAKFFENGATLSHAVVFDKETRPEEFDSFVATFNDGHRGAEKAYSTLFLGGGADVKPLSVDMRQLDFKATQGAGETRIASDAGVHPVILGLSEGLAGSSLNAGNFGAAKRLFVETTLEHLWLAAAPSLQILVGQPVIAGRRNDRAVLRHDIRDVPFVRQDAKDLAEIQQLQSAVLQQLANSGWNPDAAVRFLLSADLSQLLKQHTGLLSVQLQEPGATPPSPAQGA